MAAVARHAVDDDALPAELRPADATVLAPPASLVVMDHHALADRRVRFADAGPALGDDATRLVAGDDGFAAAAQAQGRGRVAGGAVRVQVAPAHAGGLHGDDDLPGTRRRVRELTQLELPVAEENDAAHRILLCGYPITIACSPGGPAHADDEARRGVDFPRDRDRPLVVSDRVNVDRIDRRRDRRQ